MLFEIIRREVIGVVEDSGAKGKPPVVAGFEAMGRYLDRESKNSDFCALEFEYQGVVFSATAAVAEKAQ